MHLFEFLLRDFMNTERCSHRNGTIIMHDCVPANEKMTTRDLDNLPREGWAGDVWKMIPILRRYRPDLTVSVLDCKPTVLVVVSGLNPDDRTLSESYEQIVAEMRDVSIADYGVERFARVMNMTSARSALRTTFPSSAGHPYIPGQRYSHPW